VLQHTVKTQTNTSQDMEYNFNVSATLRGMQKTKSNIVLTKNFFVNFT